MMAASPILRSLVETSKDNICYIEGICEREMKEMLRFMYTGKLQLTVDTVQSLLTCAQQLQIHQAVALCQQYQHSLQNDLEKLHSDVDLCANLQIKLETTDYFHGETHFTTDSTKGTSLSSGLQNNEVDVKTDTSDSLGDADIDIKPVVKAPVTRQRSKKVKVRVIVPRHYAEGSKASGSKRAKTRKKSNTVTRYRESKSKVKDEPPAKRKKGRPRKDEGSKICTFDEKSNGNRPLSSDIKKKTSKGKAIKKQRTARIMCDICNSKYFTKTALKYHQFKYHRLNNDTVVYDRSQQIRKLMILRTSSITEFAKVVKNTTSALLVQQCGSVNNCHQKFICKLCQKSFSLRSKFLSHMLRNHTLRVQCVTCTAKFPSFQLRLLHNRWQRLSKASIKSKMPLYKCPGTLRYFVHQSNCKKYFNNFKKKLQNIKGLVTKKKRERRGKSGKYKWSCEEGECHVWYRSAKELKDHMSSEHPDVQFICTQPNCKFKTSLKTLMASHIKLHKTNTQKMCELCGKTFTKVTMLKLHKFNKHKVVDPSLKIYKCPHEGCNYSTALNKGLQLHMGRHTDKKPFVCSYCGKKLKTAKTLEKHVSRIHMGVKPFICDKCGMAYSEEAELRLHYVRHNEVKAYQCSMCEYSSHDKGNYQTHLFARHQVKLEEDMQIQSCSICDFKTNIKSRFNDHMRVHLNMRDIPCPDCGKLFITNKTLYSHMVKVHKPKMYKCEECQYATGVAGKLREHMKLMHTHRNYKPYKCVYCKFLCASGGNCRKHIMRKHAGLEVKYIKLTESEFNIMMENKEVTETECKESVKHEAWKEQVRAAEDNKQSLNMLYTSTKPTSAVKHKSSINKDIYPNEENQLHESNPAQKLSSTLDLHSLGSFVLSPQIPPTVIPTSTCQDLLAHQPPSKDTQSQVVFPNQYQPQESARFLITSTDTILSHGPSIQQLYPKYSQ